MLALPTFMTFMFKIPFEPLVASSIGLFLMLVLFGWMFSIGVWSNYRVPKEKQRGIVLYGIGLVLPIVYVLMYIFLYIPLLAEGNPAQKPPLWLFPMHMLSLAGIFYGLWFTASQLKTLLETEKVDYIIFSNIFFLLFIFPLGLWLIQPGVNQLYSKLGQAAPAHNED